jgi:hypothetical protein
MRAERFGDGHLEVVLKSGHIMKILKRLEVTSRGSRTHLDEMPSRSRLRVIECCTEDNPFAKFLAYVLRWRGHPITMTNYLLDLGKKFGEGVNVVG